MAIEVPRQSCMRTSSGTPSTRKPSYSTGTITEPPLTPNKPARKPAITPPMSRASASQRISCNPTPRNILLLYSFGIVSGGDVRDFRLPVRHQAQRREQKLGASIRRRGAGKMAAEGACARHGAEQAVEVPGDGVQPRAPGKLVRDIRNERAGGVPR